MSAQEIMDYLRSAYPTWGEMAELQQVTDAAREDWQQRAEKAEAMLAAVPVSNPATAESARTAHSAVPAVVSAIARRMSSTGAAVSENAERAAAAIVTYLEYCRVNTVQDQITAIRRSYALT